MMPKPPALLTAAANSRLVMLGPIGAAIMGSLMPSKSQSGVDSIVFHLLLFTSVRTIKVSEYLPHKVQGRGFPIPDFNCRHDATASGGHGEECCRAEFAGAQLKLV